MKKFTMLLAALLLMSGLTWAQTTINWTAADQGYENQQEITSVDFDANVSGNFAKGTSNNSPKYYTNGTAIRCYGGNTITIVSSDANLTTISITFGSNDGTNAITTDVGTYSDGTWTGDAESVTFTIGGSSGNRRIAAFAITYGGDAPTPTVATPTFNPGEGTYTSTQTVEISCTTEGATIYYTLDGNDPTTESEEYTEALTIEETTTVKAMAVKEDYNNSAIASATYTITAPVQEQVFSRIDGHAVEAGQTYLIVDVTSGCALTSANGSSNAPAAVEVTIENDQIATNNVALQWTFEATDGGYIIYPLNSTTTWLYSTDANNGVRVGTNDNKVWALNITDNNNPSYHGFKNTNVNRYLGVYFSNNAPQDWRAYGSINNNIKNTQIELFVLGDAPTNPTITADNVDLAYDAVEGTISYTINNPVEGGVLTAEVTEGYEWISADEDEHTEAEGTVGLITDANTSATARTATVTLTYTYENRETVTKTVTVTQAAAPSVEMTIAEVRAQGTGNVVTTGVVTSCVGVTGYIQDATAAICVYGAELTVGDQIKVSGTLEDYNGLLEIKNPTVTVLSSGNTIDPELMTIAQINASTNQGWYIRIENATVTAINGQNTTIAQGENTIVVRGISGVTLSEGNVISLNGNIGCYNGVQIANPTDVEVAVSGFAYQYSINGVLGSEQHGTQITLSNGTAVGGLAFAGWTLDPDDVENILAAGSPYVLEEDGVVFYAVYSRTVASGSYVRVTETPDDWSGNYLIVNKNYGVAFNGALQPLDVVNNTINVSAYGNNVSATFETNAGIFTITPTDGDSVAIKSASGLYIGQNSDANGMLTSTETVYNNTISFGGDTVNIVGKGGAYLRYNKASNQNRFRYYKTSSYTGQQPIQLYKQEGEITTTSSFYTRVFANETATADITIVGPSIIPSGDSLTMWDSEGSYSLINDLGAEKFIIEDGARLNYYTSVLGTMQKNINACDYNSNNNAGYYLITTPIDEFEPTDENGFLTTNYDLYAFDATEDLEWRNYKAENFNLAFGKGYLYASGENTTLQFAGTLNADGMCIEDLAYVENESLKSLNLVGNPYTWSESFCLGEDGSTMGEAPETNFLSMNSAGNGFIVTTASTFKAQPLQGFFVQATAEGQLIMEAGAVSGGFDPWGGGFAAGHGNLNIKINHNNNLLDNAIVSFGNGSMLKKFYISNNSTRVYIPQGNQDFAVVRATEMGEMPVSFKAAENGTYTLSVNTENVDMDYLHLIDNKTGMDIDLLQTPSYSFEANTTDYTSRFSLVFSANTSIAENSDSFAFFSNGSLIVSNEGQATLQVIDITGRIVSDEIINGTCSVSVDTTPGVYMLRLVSGNNVKIQKVVVK